MNTKRLVVALVLGAALAAGVLLSLRNTEAPREPRSATILPVPLDLPDFRLTDHTGQPAGPSTLSGQWDLVFFGFTNCPDVCPLTLKALADARRQLEQEGFEPLPRIVLVSVDPERDSLAALAAYVGSFGEGVIGLTGPIDELRQLADALGIYFNKVGTATDFYAVDHSSVVVVIDPEGKYRALFSAPHSSETFVHDLPILLRS